MLSIQVDGNQVKELCKQSIDQLIKDMDVELVYWDAQELMRRTCMSWNFIQDQFFFDERFPKYKIGKKWYFPAREARDFLERWISEQGSK